MVSYQTLRHAADLGDTEDVDDEVRQLVSPLTNGGSTFEHVGIISEELRVVVLDHG